jgi:hypothetical protein
MLACAFVGVALCADRLAAWTGLAFGVRPYEAAHGGRDASRPMATRRRSPKSPVGTPNGAAGMRVRQSVALLSK